MDLLILSPKERLILDLVQEQGEMYGLEMVKASGGDLKRGTIYVTLGRMAEKGYVTSRQQREPGRSGLPRRLVRITALGTRVLKARTALGHQLDARKVADRKPGERAEKRPVQPTAHNTHGDASERARAHQPWRHGPDPRRRRRPVGGVGQQELADRRNATCRAGTLGSEMTQWEMFPGNFLSGNEI